MLKKKKKVSLSDRLASSYSYGSDRKPEVEEHGPEPEKEMEEDMSAMFPELNDASAQLQEEPEEPETEDAWPNAALFLNDELEEQEEIKETKLSMTAHRKAVLSKGLTVFFSVACAVLLFLIYGAVMTTYSYDPSGKVAPEAYSVSDIANKKAYEKMYVYYQMVKQTYEQVLLTDAAYSYQSADGDIRFAELGSEYMAINDRAGTLATTIKGAEVSSQYQQIIEMLNSWMTDLNTYLTDMAQFCSYGGQDESFANEAIVLNESLYENFKTITQNVADLGENVKGVDLDDIQNWSPQGYVEEKIGGN